MIINPHRDTRPCAPNYLCAFQRWLQRPLSPVEASIIEPLERLRSKNAGLPRPDPRPHIPFRIPRCQLPKIQS